MPDLTREQIQAKIPHAGAMCLLDSVIGWDRSRIHCRSESHHRDASHPLRRDGGLAAVHLIEYGAQAAAVHGGLLASASGDRPPTGGFLAGLRDVEWVDERVDAIPAALDIHAWREMGDEQGMIYRFEVASAGTRRSSGRLTIVGAT